MKEKSLTLRAADAVKNCRNSAELRSIQREVTQRIDAVDAEQKKVDLQIDKIHQSGDLDALRETRRIQADLKDEELVLRRQSSELYHAIKIAAGEEAFMSADKLEKNLSDALEKAHCAQEILSQCRATINAVIQARRLAAEIGRDLSFDYDTCYNLAMLAHVDTSAQQQALIDLGLAGRVRNARMNIGTARER